MEIMLVYACYASCFFNFYAVTNVRMYTLNANIEIGIQLLLLSLTAVT